eukprot:5689211-Pleurochrysis_carterae.AAC.1
MGGQLGEDALCTYDALRITWMEREHAVAVEERTFGKRSDTPFFTAEVGLTPWTTRHSRALAKAMGSAASGLDPAEFGGKCWRIGGATDAADLMGEDGRALIKQRGRWQSDVASVYQRTIVDKQLQDSASMGEASGVELEAIAAGWAQPARR